jgi:hypothetical protein
MPSRKASYADVLERLAAVSDRISLQVRTLALGLLAFTWAIFVGDSDLPTRLAIAFKWHLLLIAGLAIAALALDLLQYVVGYLVADSLRMRLESTNTEKGEYEYDSFGYRTQTWCFFGKQIVIGIAVCWLLVKVGIFIWTQ